jgi:adenylate cyclase class 2
VSTRNAVERELKFPKVELERLRQRLLELEAERQHGGIFEENWLFDRGTELAAERCLLRLRKDSQGAFLTFKGPASFEGTTKVRAEHETEVADPEAMRRILESLGYAVSKRYQKVREAWQLGGVTVSLDHTPIGDFAEFEGDGAEKVARRCDLDPERAERRSYMRLYEDYLVANPGAPSDMLFPDRD